MGTNYYLEIKENLGRKEVYSKLIEKGEIDVLEEYIQRGFHIGKSSAGWRFIFQETENYSTIDELRAFYEEHSDVFDVVSEYREPIAFGEFLAMVEAKKHLMVGDHNELREDGTVWYAGDFS
jgi:hypothetical protein